MQESGEREVRGEREEGRGEKEEMRRGKRMKMEKGRGEGGGERRRDMIVKLHVQSVLACIEWGPQDLR